MNILALDTCFDACSVAVRRDDGRTVAKRALMRRGHAEALMPMVAQAMQDAGMMFDELDRIAVTVGPGTFTGTRVGVAAALGLSLAHDTGVVTYSSLNCIARAAIQAIGSRLNEYDGVIAARDAKRDSIYLEVVDADGQAIEPPSLLTPTQAAGLIGARRFVGLGSGIPLLKANTSIVNLAEIVDEGLPDGFDEADARFMLCDAANRPMTSQPTPLYLRPPDATASSTPPLARAN